MRILSLLLLGWMPLAAADEARQALLVKAQSEFERVELSGVARLAEAGDCVQSQAAVIAAAAPSDASLLHYRKGFCLMVEAAVTRRPEQYTEAAAELDRALEAWPQRLPPAGAKKGTVEPVSPGLRALAAIAHLQAIADAAPADADATGRARDELVSAATTPVCAAGVMDAGYCQAIVAKGREWLGWMALEQGNWVEAGRDFSGATDGWAEWAAGRQAFADRAYPTAVNSYRTAIARFEAARNQSAPGILQSMGPRPDFAGALTDLGGSQLLAGDPSGAIATLDRAVHEDAARARPLYLRARAKETAGDSAGALTDYSLASRAAFAAAKDLASGEAHLYRGILLYRRKDLARAEDEFASALNFEIPAAMRADAQAWRHLAAVANGSCEASRGYLERSLETVSPYFPKAEARSLAAACPATASRSPQAEPAQN